MILLPILYKANKIKFIHGRPYHPQSQGSVEAFNKYIQNALISAKDHQKGEFDIDEAVSDFLQYYNSKKHSTTRHTPLDIISAANNENLIQEAIENRKKSRKKAKENREIFEIDEVVRISNFLRLISEKMFADALNPIIAKKSMKENWKIKGKIIYQKRDYCKVQIIANEGEIIELKKGSKWKIATKAILKK